MPNLSTLKAGGTSRGASLHWGDNWRHLMIIVENGVVKSAALDTETAVDQSPQ
jgi:hypothetical protein